MPNCKESLQKIDQHRVKILLPANTYQSGTISFTCHAAYHQKATIIDPAGNQTVFKGTGDDVHMVTDDGRNQLDLPTPGMDPTKDQSITLDFSFSSNGGRSYQAARKLVTHDCIGVKHISIFTIMSEDSVDNDANDTYATVMLADR